MSQPPNRNAAWRTAIAELAEDALAFFLPQLAEDRDGAKGVLLLQNAAEAETQTSELCFSVPLAQGSELRAVFIVEERNNPELAQRIFAEYCRVGDGLQVPVAVQVLLTGDVSSPGCCSADRYGTRLSFEYGVCGIADLNASDLEADGRPFAAVLLAGLWALRAGTCPDSRMRHAEELFAVVRRLDCDAEKKKSIFEFACTVFRLDDWDIDETFREEVLKMRWVPITEIQDEIHRDRAREYMLQRLRRIESEAERLGKMKGILEGKREIARNLLKMGLSADDIAQATELPEEEIRLLVNY